MEEKNTLTDEEVFASSAYATYQSSLAEAATKRYQSGVFVRMVWEPLLDVPLAYTDNKLIHINAANPITTSFPTRMLRSQSLVGMNGHEIGHMLFTDFTSRNRYLLSLGNGTFYPRNPSISLLQYKTNEAELIEALDEKGKIAGRVLSQCAAHISNILEDIYIEDRMCEKFPGSFKFGIELLNLRMEEQMQSIQYQIDNHYAEFSIMTNLLLQYCRTGDVNNLSGYTGEYMDYLMDCIPYADNSVYETDPRIRFEATNAIMVILWKYIKPMVDEAKEADDNGTGDEYEQELANSLSEQISGTPLPSGKGRPKDKSKGKGKPENRSNGRAEAQKAIHEESGRMALSETNEVSHGNNPGTTYNFNYAGSGYEDAAKDMLSVMDDVATTKTHRLYEDELTHNLQAQADDISYGDAHKGIHLNIHRLSVVPEKYLHDYRSVSSGLIPISKRLQKKVQQILKDQKEGGKLSNLLYGKRLEVRSVFREDGAYFSRTRLPSDDSKLAVALLIDESGSMHSAHRITKARETAIILQDFCAALEIPIIIYGHTEDYDVDLFSYSEFDSLDRNDRYRLMDMSARDGNRDGAALRFVAERLMTRSEKQKILILISDGQPAANGYYGSAAEADLRGIKTEYQKKGITLFSAAIGDDKESIKRIYGDGFLDISNLQDLPKLLPQLISKYII